MKKLIPIILLGIFLISLVGADYTPTDNWNFQDYYNLSNVSYLDTNYLNVDNPSEDAWIIKYQNISNIPTCGAGEHLDFDGSTLSCTADTGGGNASWNESYADTLYADISVTGDNSSWNETLADTLYLGIGDEGNLDVNSSDYWDDMNTINTTQMEDNGGTLNILESWITSFFNTLFGGKSTDDLSEGSSNFYDNSSWNETLADTLYADISVTGDNSSWNESYADTKYVETETDPQWSANYSAHNDSWSSTYNVTYDAYNNTGLIKDWNASGWIINWNATGLIANWTADFSDYFSKADIIGFGYWNDTHAGFNKTYADTLYADISVTGDNSSWNESYADTLYRAQDWDNITGIPHATPSDGDTTHFSLADEIYDWVISLAYATTTYVDSLGNWSAEKGDYWNSSLDLDTVIDDDEINESKISFGTSCGEGNHLYIDGNDLACEADDDTTYTNSSFDLSELSNTGNVSVGNYNMSINHTRFCLDGEECTKYITYNGSAVVIQG